MDPRTLDRLEAWFTGYTSGFYREDPVYDAPLRLKDLHSRKVAENMKALSEALGRSGEESLLARAIGLFHDLGRFDQYARYGTFNDRCSDNHARLGLLALFRHRAHTSLTPEERRHLVFSIAHHNRARLPARGNPSSLRFARLLRDADKLDIWRVFSEYDREPAARRSPAVDLGLAEENGFSPEVIAALEAGRMVDIATLRTRLDFRLFRLGWVFDLHFRPSYEALHRRGYLEEMAAGLPDTPEIRRVLDGVRRHLQSRL